MQLNQTKIIIHIGFHKSASTFLQNYFQKSKANYLFLSAKNRELLDYAERDKKFLPAVFTEKLSCEMGELQYSTSILSHEELSGHPHGHKTIDPYKTALNLKETFPEAKILIVIRNQFDYLKSIYSYRVAIKGQEIRSFRKFLKQEGAKGLFDKMNYHYVIENYIRLFGKDKVLVLPMELLKKNHQEFVNELNDFFEMQLETQDPHLSFAKRNESTKNRTIIFIWRIMNFPMNLYSRLGIKGWFDTRFRYGYYFFKRYSNIILNKLFRTKNLTLPQEIAKQLESNIKKSNRITQQYVRYNLHKMSYIK